MTTFEATQHYGLSLRRLPTEIVETNEMQHARPGDITVESEVKSMPYERYEQWVKRPGTNPDNWRFDPETRKVYRRFTRRFRTPKHPGWWMCKQVDSTSSNVSWSQKTDNLAPTLDESVQMFLAGLLV